MYRVWKHLLIDNFVDLQQIRLQAKERAATEVLRLSPCVGIAENISNFKFIEDFDKIVNFMLYVCHA